MKDARWQPVEEPPPLDRRRQAFKEFASEKCKHEQFRGDRLKEKQHPNFTNSPNAEKRELTASNWVLHNEGMKCPTCESTKICKNGHRQGRQNYICRDCGRQFLDSYLPKGYSDEIKQQCLTMYLNGMGFRGIQRVTGVHHTTVIYWVKQAGSCLPEQPEMMETQLSG